MSTNHVTALEMFSLINGRYCMNFVGISTFSMLIFLQNNVLNE
jgi:hypothetical protein